jgi:hypothetical protein
LNFSHKNKIYKKKTKKKTSSFKTMSRQGIERLAKRTSMRHDAAGIRHRIRGAVLDELYELCDSLDTVNEKRLAELVLKEHCFDNVMICLKSFPQERKIQHAGFFSLMHVLTFEESFEDRAGIERVKDELLTKGLVQYVELAMQNFASDIEILECAFWSLEKTATVSALQESESQILPMLVYTLSDPSEVLLVPILNLFLRLTEDSFLMRTLLIENEIFKAIDAAMQRHGEDKLIMYKASALLSRLAMLQQECGQMTPLVPHIVSMINKHMESSSVVANLVDALCWLICASDHSLAESTVPDVIACIRKAMKSHPNDTTVQTSGSKALYYLSLEGGKYADLCLLATQAPEKRTLTRRRSEQKVLLKAKAAQSKRCRAPRRRTAIL